MSRLILILTSILAIQGCVGAATSVVKQANFAKQITKHSETELGLTQSQLVSVYGKPARIFRNAASNVSLLYYCDYGFTDEQHYGYFVHDDFGYFDGFIYSEDDLNSYPENSKGVWVDENANSEFNCHHDVRLDWSFTPTPPRAQQGWTRTEYNIDRLRVVTLVQKNGQCTKAAPIRIILEGQISPDSSFAIDRLLDRMATCSDAQDQKGVMTISMKSGGGLLKDGYALGKTLRKNQVKAVIEDGAICASSCAVAFLGASQRVVEDQGQVMFHAPYFSGRNEYGQRDINCDVGDDALDDLLSYYKSMTGAETGERLFERTMWYCSAEDGWVVTGGAAAELYGIATEK